MRFYPHNSFVFGIQPTDAELDFRIGVHVVRSKNLPEKVSGFANVNTDKGEVYACTVTGPIPDGPGSWKWTFSSPGPMIPIKKITEQKLNGGEPAIKGLKGNVNHDVINELSLAGVDYMQGNIFNQLFVQGAL